MIKNQIPGPTGAPENSLAECMLPEGGHLHETDSTVFFIPPQNLKTTDSATESWMEDNGDVVEATRMFPLQQQCQTEVCESLWQIRCYAMDTETKQYGLINDGGGLVRVRFRVAREATQTSPPQYSLDVEHPDDKGVIRSILVTMDLRYAFRDEDRFAVIDFDPESLCSLSLQFESQDDLLRFESVICKVMDSTAGNVYAWDLANDSVQESLLDPELEKRYADYREMDAALLVCLNIVRTRKIQSVRRGAVVKALAVVTSRRYIEMFRPLLSKALDEIFEAQNDEQVLSFLNQLYLVLSSAQCPAVQASPLHTRVIRGLCGYGSRCPFSAFEVPLAGESFTLQMPIVDVYEDELGGVSVVELVQVFGESVMILYNGILLGRRVLFLGHNMAASLVSRLVLAAAALIRPLSAGVLHRLFPYAHLTNLAFLQTPGFIAGVTNPIFANHWDWFDIFADIKQGTVQVKSKDAVTVNSANGPNASIASPPEKISESANASHEAIDLEMYAQMTSAGTATFGEEFTRGSFYDHTLSLLDQVASKELFRDDTRRRVSFDGNSARLSEYRAAKHHDYHDVSQKYAQRHSLFGRHFNTIKTSVRLLQVRRLPSRQIQNIFEEIRSRLITEEHVWQLLDLLPECRSGLIPIAICLFGHHSVQKEAFALLERIESTGVGAKAIDQLPLMLLMAYRRLKRERKESQHRESAIFPDYIQKRESFSRLRTAMSASVNSSPTAVDMSRLIFPDSSTINENPSSFAPTIPFLREDSGSNESAPGVMISMVRPRDISDPTDEHAASIESNSDDDAIDTDGDKLRQPVQSDDSAYARSDIGSED